jgi:hypothetical protein
MWRGMRTYLILRCLDDPEWLNNWGMLVGAVPEFVSWLTV